MVTLGTLDENTTFKSHGLNSKVLSFHEKQVGCIQKFIHWHQRLCMFRFVTYGTCQRVKTGSEHGSYANHHCQISEF